MKNLLHNQALLFLGSLILPIAAYEAFVTGNEAVANILFALFAAVMALIIARK